MQQIMIFNIFMVIICIYLHQKCQYNIFLNKNKFELKKTLINDTQI